MLGFAVKFTGPDELYPFLDYWLQIFRQDWWWFWVQGERPGDNQMNALYVFGTIRALEAMRSHLQLYFDDEMANLGPRSLLWFVTPQARASPRVRFFWYRFYPKPGDLRLFRQVPPAGWTDSDGRSYIIEPPDDPVHADWRYHWRRVIQRQVISSYADINEIRRALQPVRLRFRGWVDNPPLLRQIRLPVIRTEGASSPGEYWLPRRYRRRRRY